MKCNEIKSKMKPKKGFILLAVEFLSCFITECFRCKCYWQLGLLTCLPSFLQSEALSYRKHYLVELTGNKKQRNNFTSQCD